MLSEISIPKSRVSIDTGINCQVRSPLWGHFRSRCLELGHQSFTLGPLLFVASLKGHISPSGCSWLGSKTHIAHISPGPSSSCACGAQEKSRHVNGTGFRRAPYGYKQRMYPWGERLGQEGTKKGRGKLHTRQRKSKHANRTEWNMFIIFLLSLF